MRNLPPVPAGLPRSRACPCWPLLALLLTWAATTSAQQEPAPAGSAEASAPLTVAAIIARADRATNDLRTLSGTLARPDRDLESAGRRLVELRENLDRHGATLPEAGIGELTILDLRGRRQTLLVLGRQAGQVTEVLQRVVNRLDGSRLALRADLDFIAAARDPARAEALPELLEQRLTGLETVINGQRQRLDERLATAVAQLGVAADLQRDLDDALAAVDGELARQQEGLLRLSAPPLWQAAGASREPPGDVIAREFRLLILGTLDFVEVNGGPLLVFALLSVLVLVAGLRLRRLPAAAGSPAAPPLLQRHPLAIVILVWSLLGPELLLDELVPGLAMVRALLVAGALWVLLPELVASALVTPLRGLLLATFVLSAERFLLGDVFYGRLLNIAVAIVAIFLFRRVGRELTATGLQGPVLLLRAGKLLARLAPPLLALGALADVAGAVLLSSQLIAGLLFLSMAFIAYAVADNLLQELLAVFIRGPGSRWSRAIAHFPDLVLRRGSVVVRVLLIVGFLILLPRLLPMLGTVGSAVGTLLGTPVTLGTLNVSVADLLVFVLGVLIAVTTARLVRFLLDEDVFSRLPMDFGTASAASRLIYYALLLGGLVFAFAAAGLELSQLTLIVGALSLGIGFGLQNIVNNFVSGLVIAFERPFREGDQIAVGQLTGRIQEIGLRASRLRTFDGAEVIVPNGNLISGEVVNWTLSDRARRIDVTVGVSYGSDVTRVQEVLASIPQQMERVAPSPTPVVLFRGFGESSLDFSLLFWTPDADHRFAVESEARSRILAAFREAGIEIPFPQRDIHIRSGPPPAP